MESEISCEILYLHCLDSRKTRYKRVGDGLQFLYVLSLFMSALDLHLRTYLLNIVAQLLSRGAYPISVGRSLIDL
jgi:hypothetical protein